MSLRYSTFNLIDVTAADKLPRVIRKNLLHQPAAIQDSGNEIALNKRCASDKQPSLGGLCLAIAPILNASFSCVNSFNITMDELTQNNLIAFVESKLAADIKRELQVKWIDGESALVRKIIFNLTRRLKKLALRYRCNYHSVLISNGYLLEQLRPSDFSYLAIKTIQLVLDGPEAILGNDIIIPNYYVINPQGLVFKCLHDIAMPHRAIYNVNTQKTCDLC